jgi:tetratricopeptide (TPR) repeat protein
LLLPDAPEEVADPQQWLFLDTETTGLSGGTGTYPFLVGLAWWEDGLLKVEQLFMREYSEEPSMLLALAARLEERPVLVTFNGKSFDWPLLETRFRMTRSIPVPKLRAHLDFLHPARNLWHLRFGSVKLSQLERHVLGEAREEDLMSAQIPGIYLDFVRRGYAEPLVPVFLHNQMDLEGLARIADRIVSLLGNEDASGQHGLELFGLSRMCERRGQTERARRIYEQSLGAELPTETERAARAALARLAKRDGDFERACDLWKSMLGNSREGYEAYGELAIYYEHHARDAQHALAITCEALTKLRRARQLGMIAVSLYTRAKAQFEHRRQRLDRKTGRVPSNLFREKR